MTVRRDDLASWGRTPRATPKRVLAMPWSGQAPVWNAHDAPMLAYGCGRSYGDVCLNNGGTIIRTSAMSLVQAFDVDYGVIRAEAGITLEQLLRCTIPRGWFLPVVPGTRYVTIGGAVANDIHGKNHHRRGTFGCHVRRFELLRSDGTRCVCSPTEHVDLFRATIGGLGLTGIITWVEIQLIPITSTSVNVDRVKVRSLDEAMDVLEESDESHEYTVTWIDTTASERQTGRGHVIRGNHAHDGACSIDSISRPPRITIPIEAPEWLLHRSTVGVFNTLYHQRQQARHRRFVSDIVPFFWPLDAIGSWNRLYGARGMLQYQVVVPLSERHVIRTILVELRRAGIVSFLGVLKTFGSISSPGIMSFPRPGITLSLDLANQGAAKLRLFDKLDSLVIDAGGALYPAKDSRMSAATFRASFPGLTTFRQHLDPAFSSTFWRRVTQEPL